MSRSTHKRSLFGIFLALLLAFTIVYVVGYSLYLGARFTDILQEYEEAAGANYDRGSNDVPPGGAAYQDQRFASSSYSQNTSELLVTYNDSTWFRFAVPFEGFASLQKHPLLKAIQNSLGFGKAAAALPHPRYVVSLDYISFPITKPEVCTSNATTGRLHLLAIVVSAPEHVKQRNAIRETWGSVLKMRENRCALLFFLGYRRPAKTASSATGSFFAKLLDDNSNRAVELEDQKHGDIVQANFTESYRNLTLKSVLMLRWVTENCAQAKYVLKTDDDMFINVINLLKFTAAARHSEHALIGRLAHNWRPVRNTQSKWYVSRKDFPFRSYPPFVTGPAYIFGAKVAPALLNACLQMPFFFLEDVFVTGLCAAKAKIPRYSHVDFINYRVPLNVCRYQSIISSHDITVKELKLLWPRVVSEDKTLCKRQVLPRRRGRGRF